jgi:hypothetical protein
MLSAARPAILDEEGQRGFGTAAGVDPRAERELGVAGVLQAGQHAALRGRTRQ